MRDDEAEARRQRRKAWHSQVFHSRAEASASDRTAYLDLTPEERVALVWRLSQELYGIDPDAPVDPSRARLNRSITRLLRRSR